MRILLLMALVGLISGCATGYHKLGYSGGTSETQLDEAVYRVRFHGNGYTRKTRAVDFAMLRSAEIGLENGYKYFAVVEGEAFISTSVHNRRTEQRTTGTISHYGNISDINMSTTTSGGPLVVNRPTSDNLIYYFFQKPEDISTYSCEIVYKSLTDQYGVDQRPELINQL